MPDADEPRAPMLADDLPVLADAELEAGEVWEEGSVTGDFTGADARGVELRECRVEQALFTAASLERLEGTDVLFEDCDLSGAVLRGAILVRAVFRNCRMASVDLANARLEDASFSGCKLDGANLRMVRGRRLVFEDCSLVGADLYEAAIERLRLVHSDLQDVEFSGAALEGVRLHGSRLTGIRGARGLAGAVIDAGQIVDLAVPLLAELGITVEDGSDL